MTVQKAKVIFATHMQASRSRSLTNYERQQLNIARQVLRSVRKPIMNKKSKYSNMSLIDISKAIKAIKKRYKETGGNITSDENSLLRELADEFNIRVERGIKKPQSNPRGVLIYGRVNRIVATKTQNHVCDAQCIKHGHRYYHDFSSRPKMYGLPNGDILITTR